MSQQIESAPTSKMELIKWLITILVPAVIYLIPVNEVFTAQVRLFLVYTLFVILLMAFEFFDTMFTAMLIPLGYIMLGLAPAATVYSGWAGGIPAMIIGGLLLSNVLEETGLLKRIAYWCILKTGGSFKGILFGIFFAGIILSFMTAAGAPLIMAALCYGVCKALDLGVSKESSAVMMVGAFSSVSITTFIYYPAMVGLLEAGAKSVDPSLSITYFSFLVRNFPYIFLLLLFVLLLAIFYKPSHPINGKTYFETELKRMGKVNKNEIKVGVLTLIIIILLMTASLHHIPGTMVFAILPWLLYVPGMKVGSPQAIRNINYGLAFFIVACLSIGSVSGHLGLGAILADIVVPMLQPLSSTAVLAAVWVIGVLLNFLLTPFAIAAAFAAPIAQIATALNINVEGAMYVLYNSMDTVFLPYEYAGYLIFYGFGVLQVKDFVKIMSVKALLSFIFILIVMIPFWRLVGVL